MQKHEREVFRAVREIAEPAGITVKFDEWAGSTHRKLTLHTPDGRWRQTVVGSSPKNRDHTVVSVTKWARKTVKELTNG